MSFLRLQIESSYSMCLEDFLIWIYISQAAPSNWGGLWLLHLSRHTPPLQDLIWTSWSKDIICADGKEAKLLWLMIMLRHHPGTSISVACRILFVSTGVILFSTQIEVQGADLRKRLVSWLYSISYENFTSKESLMYKNLQQSY